jgi:hypothetical protein
MVNKSGDEVNISPIDDDMIYSVRYSVFGYGCERVWKTGAAAELLNRSPRSIYRYESLGQIQKAKRYRDRFGRELRFYTKKDILEIQELISSIHGGRPSKSKRIINNGVPSRVELLATFRERFGE